jgi:lysophospholipase L1-like esterase
MDFSCTPLSKSFFLLAACLLFTLVSPARALTNLGNIMPVGDSITDGVGSTGGGYRDPLYTDLTTAGYSFTFVGALSDDSTPLLTATGETHHEGYSGYVIESQAPNFPTSSGQGGIMDVIGGDLANLPASQKPNTFLLMIGSNDMFLNYDVAQAPNRLESLIDMLLNPITGLDPGAQLILAEVTPTGDGRTTQNSLSATYNAAILLPMEYIQTI